MKKNPEEVLSLNEKLSARATQFSFEGHWRNASRAIKDTFKHEYCQGIVDFYLAKLDLQAHPVSDNGIRLTVAPPHLSQYARSIGVSTKSLRDWGEMFPEFLAALNLANDIHLEMLSDGALLGDYNPKIAKLLMDYRHGIREKQEVLVNHAMIPLSAAQSINYLLEQQGLPPVKIPDAEFTEVKVEDSVARKP